MFRRPSRTGGAGSSGSADPFALLHLESQLYFSGTPTFTSPALFKSPSGITNAVLAKCWGAGGGGLTATGGGGGGAYAEGEVPIFPSTGYPVVVPAGGAVDTTGGDASFNTTSVVAKGGLSRTAGGTGGTAAASTGTTKFSGGDGTAGAGNVAGGGGAGSLGAGVAAAGGQAEGGVGQNATAGRALGGGGGSSGAAGQTGGRGGCQVDYDIPAAVGFARRRRYAVSRNGTTSTTLVCNMPSGIVAGELLLCEVAVDSAFALSAPGDWTQLGAQINDGTNAVGMAVFYKFAAGGDTLTVTSATTSFMDAVVTRYANAGAPTMTTASGNSTNANPPAHSFPAGNYIVKAVAATDADNVPFSAIPATYTGGVLITGYAGAGIQLAQGHKTLTGTSEDPGTFTNASEQWVAATIAIPYA